MNNPFAPTVHFNIRYIETEKKSWLAGGYDLTPMGFPFEEDTRHFHRTAKEALDPFGEELYPAFSNEAKHYFYIPHRNKERGMEGSSLITTTVATLRVILNYGNKWATHFCKPFFPFTKNA